MLGILLADVQTSFAQQDSEAIEVYLKRLEEYRRAGDQDDVNTSLLQIAFLYWNKGVSNKAIEFFSESVEINKSIGNDYGAAQGYHYIGVICAETGQRDLAISNLKNSLSIRRKLKDKSGISSTLLQLGIINFDNGDPKKAIQYLEECLGIAKEISSTMEVTDSYLYLAKSHEALGNKEEALRYHKFYTDGFKYEGQRYINDLTQQYNDDKSRLQKQKKLTELELEQHKTELEIIKLREREIAALAKARKNEIELLEKTKELQNAKLQEQEAKLRADKILITSIIIGLVLTAIMAALVTWAYVQKNKANRLLQSQKREIEKSSIQLRIQNEKVAASEENIRNQNVELEEKNTKLLELHGEISQLNNILAKDLKEPLEHLEDLLEIVDEHVASLTPAQIDFINVVAESTMHFRTLIADIEEIERIKSDKHNVKMEMVDVAKTLNGIISEAQAEFATPKSIEIQFSKGDDSQTQVKVEPNYIKQVFKTLILNAVKYTPEGKEVKVIVSQKDQKLITRIKDQGPGIGKEQMETIFSKYRLKGGSKTGGEESRSGLSVVKEYTDLLGGRVWCECNEGETGTSFYVELLAKTDEFVTI